MPKSLKSYPKEARADIARRRILSLEVKGKNGGKHRLQPGIGTWAAMDYLAKLK